MEKKDSLQNTPDSLQTVEVQKVPDYMGLAPAKLKEYYPEEAYFQKILNLQNRLDLKSVA